MIHSTIDNITGSGSNDVEYATIGMAYPHLLFATVFGLDSQGRTCIFQGASSFEVLLLSFVGKSSHFEVRRRTNSRRSGYCESIRSSNCYKEEKGSDSCKVGHVDVC